VSPIPCAPPRCGPLSPWSSSRICWDQREFKRLVTISTATNLTSLIYNMARHIKDFFVPNLWLKTRHIFEGHVDEWGSYRDKKSDYNNIDKILTEQFTASLRSFVMTSRSWGIEPILMTQFNRFQHDDAFIRATYEKLPQPVSYDDFVLLYKKTNEITRKVAKEEKSAKGKESAKVEEKAPGKKAPAKKSAATKEEAPATVFRFEV
jgi:hypothetical protein